MTIQPKKSPIGLDGVPAAEYRLGDGADDHGGEPEDEIPGAA